MLAMLFMALMISFTFVACDNDEDDPVLDGPTVTAPANQDVVAGESVDLTFTFTAPGGFKSSTVTAVNGAATVKTDGTAGATNGSVVVTFTAGTQAGAGSVVLNVTDNQSKTDDATAVITVVAEQTVFEVSSNITQDETWETGKVYILKSRIAVVSGATLTIQKGVVVKGEAGTGANATALLIARGGKLMAEGTADQPIIFTSVADEIMPGEIASPNLDPDIDGLWGGLLILGKARISASNENGDVSEVQIEGIPTSDPNGLYGGNDDPDNSGVIKYISIRHGGTNIGSGNEINGLTLGGVGSGTVIENVEVIANQDDGIEWFGGAVNVKNVVVWNVNDDGIDTDQSWSGTLDNFVVIAPAGHNFELDGPEGSFAAGHTIKNGTVVCSDAEFGRTSEDLINVDNNSIVALQNIYFTAITAGQQINRVTAVGVGFEGIELNVAPGDLQSHVNGDIPAGVTAGGSPRADVSVLGWTWAAAYGKLTGL
ncbi:MAG: hypothetical protein IH598_00930 [Bacteroidales bacterium]|nr:hypothetical protein [Bacteroidales bacterium]